MKDFKRALICVLLFCGGIPVAINAQSQGYIYGKVTLKNGQTYQGQIRWDNREAMWDHIFDAYKADRPYQNLLSASDAKILQAESGDFKFGFMELWEDRSPDMSFMFRCSFGDMVKLESGKGNIIALTLKNGHHINLRNTGGDVDRDIVVVDRSVGKQKFKFGSIQSIAFESTPIEYKSPMGEPVYGKVLTANGVYEGYITWDQEECLGNDIISGKLGEVLLDVPFKTIRQIKAERDGSIITLITGRELFLNDHDDVDAGNHGIMVRGLKFGTVEIDWENFISVDIFKPARPAAGYQEFASPTLLTATIRTNEGAKLTSQIVFDLDEIYNIEFLNGANGGFNYFIPFSLVTSIEPQNDKFSSVTVQSGEQFLLGDSDDVDIKNNGLILKFSENSAQFLEWKQVKSIQFDQ